MHPLWPHVQTFRPQLWRAVCGYELNPAVREELLQDVLLAIWESLPRLREAEMLLPFVLRIAHNLGASHVRSEIRRPASLPFDAQLHDVADTGSSCARTQWLFEALVTLPLNQRQVLMLQLEGYDYQQIADLRGQCPARATAARPRRRRACRRLCADPAGATAHRPARFVAGPRHGMGAAGVCAAGQCRGVVAGWGCVAQRGVGTVAGSRCVVGCHAVGEPQVAAAVGAGVSGGAAVGRRLSGRLSGRFCGIVTDAAGTVAEIRQRLHPSQDE